jgi:hypothetical protein
MLPATLPQLLAVFNLRQRSECIPAPSVSNIEFQPIPPKASAVTPQIPGNRPSPKPLIRRFARQQGSASAIHQIVMLPAASAPSFIRPVFFVVARTSDIRSLAVYRDLSRLIHPRANRL